MDVEQKSQVKHANGKGPGQKRVVCQCSVEGAAPCDAKRYYQTLAEHFNTCNFRIFLLFSVNNGVWPANTGKRPVSHYGYGHEDTVQCSHKLLDISGSTF